MMPIIEGRFLSEVIGALLPVTGWQEKPVPFLQTEVSGEADSAGRSHQAFRDTGGGGFNQRRHRERMHVGPGAPIL